MGMKKTMKTKAAFEKALFALLESKNYHDITINEICASAGKTKMTFYHYFKDKADLLAQASIDLVNEEYNAEYEEILKKETDPEEIEYRSLVATYEWVAKHYGQIQNLVYEGETLPLEVFKSALLDNYRSYMSGLIEAGGYDIPGDYLSIFCFEGLYGSALHYARQLAIPGNAEKAREGNRKVCRLLAKAVLSLATAGATEARRCAL